MKRRDENSWRPIDYFRKSYGKTTAPDTDAFCDFIHSIAKESKLKCLAYRPRSYCGGNPNVFSVCLDLIESQEHWMTTVDFDITEEFTDIEQFTEAVTMRLKAGEMLVFEAMKEE